MAVAVARTTSFQFKESFKKLYTWVLPLLIAACLVLYGLAAGQTYLNYAVFVGFLTAVGVFFGTFIMFTAVRGTEWVFRHSALVIWTIFVPASLILALSSFVFPEDARNIYIVGERTTLSQTIIARPFWDDIKRFSWFQHVTTSVEGVTVDGVKVRATLKAALVRVDEEPLVIAFAKKSINPDEDVQVYLQAWFNREFANFVATKKHTELQDNLALEYGAVANVTDKALEGLAVRWDGEVRITDLHPSFKKSHIRPVG